MDKRLKTYYERELIHLREVGNEFAREFPKIAQRLGHDPVEWADPYVERLLEGFAFLTARVNLKLDSEFPRFTQGILETVYPHYLSPTPSMTIVQFKPDFADTALAEGVTLKRQRALKSIIGGRPATGGAADTTACEYRTAHDVTLWPIQIVKAEYTSRGLASLGAPNVPGAKAGIRLRLRAAGPAPFKAMKLDALPLFIYGAGPVPGRIYEQLIAHTIAMSVQPARSPAPWHHIVRGGVTDPAGCLRLAGFADDQALLPFGPRSFHGYRLLHEYFVLPQRFMFAELRGLNAGVRRCEDAELDVVLLLKEADNDLEAAVSADNFKLFCTPAINLFPRRADRIQVSDRFYEFHVVPDRTRPLDFEIWDITRVEGFTEASPINGDEFRPFYAATDDGSPAAGSRAYYSVNRLPRAPTAREAQFGRRSSYSGSEVYISLVDARHAPYREDLKTLAVQTRCTNRDLPLRMPVGRGTTDFVMDDGGPVESIRVLVGPTQPRDSFAAGGGDTAWRVISHLSLNYLSLCDAEAASADTAPGAGVGRTGGAAMRDLFKLYSDQADAAIRKQIEGLRAVQSRPIVRRVGLPGGGPVAFARGLEVNVTMDEASFEGVGAFVFGAVLDHFFAKYVSLNSFTETVVRSADRGEIMRWPARIGLRQIV